MERIPIHFLLIPVMIYASVHAYVLGRLFTWANLPLDIGYILWVAGLTFSFFFAMFLELKYSHWLTNAVYITTVSWMGIIGILLLAVILGEVASFFLSEKEVLLTIAAFTIISTLAGILKARQPILRRYARKGGVNLKIGLLTDIHLGPVHGKKYAQNIVARFKKEKIDVLLLAGDIIDGPGELPKDILTPFNDLKKPVFMSWGNHEHYLGEKLTPLLKQTTIIPLRNKQVTVKGITLIGIDDSEDKQQLAKQLPNFKAKGYTVLMYHRPDGLEDAAKHNIDLMVSGHTHKGQIFPFTLLVKARFPHIAGWYKEGKTWLFVSTGAGTWGPPFRFGSRSEMVVIDVKK